MYLDEYCLDGQIRCKRCFKVTGTADIFKEPGLKYHIPKEYKAGYCLGCYILTTKGKRDYSIGDEELAKLAIAVDKNFEIEKEE